MSRSERNREKRREQLVRFLNVRIEDFKLFKEKEEKEFTNCAFTRGFKLSCGRFVRSAVLDRLLDFIASFCFRIASAFVYVRVTLLFFNSNIII